MGETVTVQLRDSWEEYPLIPARTRVREFFPGYKETFTLHIEDNSFRTYVTGRTQGQGQAERGSSTAGTYIRASINDLSREYPEITGGDKLTIEKEDPKEYRIIDW